MKQLVPPTPGRAAAERFVTEHFRSLTDGPIEGSTTFVGGSKAGARALAKFDVTGYAERINEVTPHKKRSASSLSPYLRHGLLAQAEVWAQVEGGPEQDVEKFRESLLWQEYARHWYSRLGNQSRVGTEREAMPGTNPPTMDPDMACLEMVVEELEEEGWLVGRARTWLSAYWAGSGGSWNVGEEYFFRELLDGSRASNRVGWQITAGLNGNRPFAFNRWQVERWAAGLCASCELVRNCPVEEAPVNLDFIRSETPVELKVARDLSLSAGPPTRTRYGTPDVVWLTAESLGSTDPALSANPELPVVFVFDEPLLERIRISPKRLVFLVETLAEMAEDRELEVWLGEPGEVLARRAAAVTFAPVPGFAVRSLNVGPVEIYPWPWLVEPTTGDLTTFREWRRSVGRSWPLSSLLA